MLQRVQTLFLTGVIVFLGLMFVFPIWEKANPESGRKLVLDVYFMYDYQAAGASANQWEVVHKTPVFYIAATVVLAALMALYVIFRYDNRPLQIKLNAFNAFLVMATIAMCAWFIYMGEIEIGEHLMGTFKPGFFLPVGALLCISLANRFIKKDEDLVRSVDRIR